MAANPWGKIALWQASYGDHNTKEKMYNKVNTCPKAHFLHSYEGCETAELYSDQKVYQQGSSNDPLHDNQDQRGGGN